MGAKKDYMPLIQIETSMEDGRKKIKVTIMCTNDEGLIDKNATQEALNKLLNL